MSPLSAAEEMVLAPTVKLNGAEISSEWADALRSMKVELALNLPGRASLRFADQTDGYAIVKSRSLAVGSGVSVSWGTKALFDGEITGLTVERRADTGDPTVTVVAHDKSARMGRSTRVAGYSDSTWSDVVRRLAGEHGLGADVTATSDVFPVLVQADTDLDYLNVLAQRVGYDWWVEGGTLHFAKPSTQVAAELAFLDQLLDISVRATALQPDTFEVIGWDRDKQAPIKGRATGIPLQAQVGSPFEQFMSQRQRLGSATATAAGLGPQTQGEADGLATALLRRSTAAAISCRGRAEGNARIKVGKSVKITGTGPTDGTFHVTEVEHAWDRRGFFTRFEAGERRSSALVDLLGVPLPGTASEQRSLVIGIVTNIKDPDNRARVKVKFPGLSDTVESAWARQITVGGGKERGLVFVPEVNDEVLLGFEGGDLRRPVILGGLFGSKSTAPAYEVDDQGKIAARMITSRLGHVIELSDGEQKPTKYVLVALAGGATKFHLGEDKVELIAPAGTPLRIASGSSTEIAIDDKGSLTLKAMNIAIQAEGKLSIKSTGPATVESSATLGLEGKGEASLKGGMTQVEGTGPLTLKGAMVSIN